MGMPLIWILVAISVALVVSGLRRPEGVYQYPFLAGATFLGFIAPQFPALVDDPFLPVGAMVRTILFTILCVSACGFGWRVTLPRAARPPWQFEERRLLVAAAVFSVIGGYFYVKVSHLPPEIKYSIFTGMPVVYLFFAKLLNYGFAIALVCGARRMSLAALAIIGFDTLFYAERILILGRRSEAVEFFFLVVLAWWFQKRRTPPRLLTAGFVLFGALALHSAGDYRAITTERDEAGWSDLLKIDLVENFAEVLEQGGPEVRNAVLRIGQVRDTHAYDLGLFHWNTLVFNYVPAQLVGVEIKERLTVSLDGQLGRDYEPPVGSTETGLSDAFASFAYLGALKFFLIGFAMRRIYDAAMAGSTVWQVVYPLMLAPAMLSITHHTQWPPSAFLHIALFLLPALAFARVRQPADFGAQAPVAMVPS
ncbi:hypothetical protein [Kaistia nematophila]|uniref:Oligosaccharide repeat unit polymerase n=1 Tax=Kaistia nematophila TaxID=2994654 RepID=A0A9X3IKI3_9HYPH|nr:hypothetical protein [Kaistia nematophila]MCX5568521.1 hypothetical protein [Kaistia nematophila]